MEQGMVNRTESIRIFLEHVADPQLAALYSPGMEVQVMVWPRGDPIDGVTQSGHRWRGWRTRDGFMIKNFRIPWNAGKNPEYKDAPINWPIETFCKAVGMTGWSFAPAESRFFVYDFDSLVGHSQGLEEEQLREVQERLTSLPWVTIRKSKSGQGIHCYVQLKSPEPTQNHTEHSALARAILVRMSQEAEFDFNASVDICGENAWVWHAEKKEGGFDLIKQATTLIDAPKDWRDHLNFLTRHRSRPKPAGVPDEFYQVSGSQTPQKLDEEHQALLDYLESSGAFYYWQPENNCLVTHTYSLTLAHEELQLRGPYSTVATGKDFQQDKNCYCFPIDNGAWVVRRFSKGVVETTDWDEDRAGWTRCFYNSEPRVKELVERTLSKEIGKKGVYLASYEEIKRINERIGKDAITLPKSLAHKDFTVKTGTEGVEIQVKKGRDEPTPDGWRKVHGAFKQQITETVDTPREKANVLGDMDDQLRLVLPPYSNSDSTAKYYGRNRDGTWNRIDKEMATSLLSSQYGGESVNFRKNALRENPWRRVYQPFKSEYPGNRCWNLDPVTYACAPEEGPYPTWEKLYNQLGQSLDYDLAQDDWARDHGVETGRHYLELWVASVLQHPQFKLPYLFFFGRQKGGKSLFHESLRYLIGNGGVVDASTALRYQHNAEIAKAVICTCDDVDLTKEKSNAYEKIKRWVTSIKMTIDQKYMSTYEVDNFTHFIQCNNPPGACPAFPGDTRITVIFVPGIPDTVQIAKSEMERDLQQEAPCFLNHLLKLTIPSCRDRMRIPCIETSYKEELVEEMETACETYLRENTTQSPGSFILVSEFLNQVLSATGVEVNPRTLSSQIGPEHTRGRIPTMVNGKESGYAIGNRRWNDDPEPDDSTPWIRQGRYLTKG